MDRSLEEIARELQMPLEVALKGFPTKLESSQGGKPWKVAQWYVIDDTHQFRNQMIHFRTLTHWGARVNAGKRTCNGPHWESASGPFDLEAQSFAKCQRHACSRLVGPYLDFLKISCLGCLRLLNGLLNTKMVFYSPWNDLKRDVFAQNGQFRLFSTHWE